MRKSSLPNLRGCRALVLHRSDSNSETLIRQLESLGLTVRRKWPADDVSAEGLDVVFFEAQASISVPSNTSFTIPRITRSG